jgi:ferritin-like metal-binding protein YciE
MADNPSPTGGRRRRAATVCARRRFGIGTESSRARWLPNLEAGTASMPPRQETRMATAEERLMEWLRDAHAAEEQAETMLTGMANRIENYPELKARIEQHIQETKRQAELIRGCIERRGGSTSTIKDAGAKLLAMGQAMSGMFVGDEVMKGSIASTAFEAMEVASYKILIATAEQVGDMETRRVCEQILREEEAMEDWLKQNLPMLTQRYLRREETPGVTAKH